MGGFTKQEKAKKIQRVAVGKEFISDVLDGTTTTQTLKLGSVVGKVSIQSTGTLAGTVAFSINGKDFKDSTAFTATELISYSTHNCLAIKLTRTGGEGRVAIAVM